MHEVSKYPISRAVYKSTTHIYSWQIYLISWKEFDMVFTVSFFVGYPVPYKNITSTCDTLYLTRTLLLLVIHVPYKNITSTCDTLYLTRTLLLLVIH